MPFVVYMKKKNRWHWDQYLDLNRITLCFDGFSSTQQDKQCPTPLNKKQTMDVRDAMYKLAYQHHDPFTKPIYVPIFSSVIDCGSICKKCYMTE